MNANSCHTKARHNSFHVLLLLAVGAFALPSWAEPPEKTLSTEDAELMGRVGHFFLTNFRDVTSRKSLDWGRAETDESGNRTIRYEYIATIWDEKKMVMNQRFTFDEKGLFVKVDHVEGYPREVEEVQWDTSTDEGIKKRVEHFFTRNYRDITDRKTVEWGDAGTNEDGNRYIRYKFEATIRGKDVITVITQNKIFTFSPAGEYVSVKDVEDVRI